MPPEWKARKLSSDTRAPLEEQRSLVDLPDLVLSAIAKHGFDSSPQRWLWAARQTGHPMLAVARSLRDAVLASLAKIRLDLRPQRDSCCQPEARLLHRACCQAAPGLQVELDLGNNQHALPQLLQPALDAGGWHNVHRLKVNIQGAEFLNLLGSAMPALRHVYVDMDGGDIHGGGLFTGLQLCRQLSTLCLEEFTISPAAVGPAATALAQLPALRDLCLATPESCDTNVAEMIEELTCLTALELWVKGCDWDDEKNVQSMFTAAARNPALRVFRTHIGVLGSPAAADIQHLLEACPSLSDLDLSGATVSPDALEVLLTHGTSITSLGAEFLETEVSLADRPCSWKYLFLESECYPSVLHLAHLPLRGVTFLRSQGTCLDLATLQLPLCTMAAEDMPWLLHQAATNLAACPAWKAAPLDSIDLEGDPRQYWDQDTVIFSAQERIQLLEALAPLGGPHVTKFAGDIQGTWFEWGRAEVQALAGSLRSDKVTTLSLNYCHLAADSWAALDEFLPELETLQLGKHATYSTLDIGRKFVLLCTR